MHTRVEVDVKDHQMRTVIDENDISWRKVDYWLLFCDDLGVAGHLGEQEPPGMFKDPPIRWIQINDDNTLKYSDYVRSKNDDQNQKRV